MQIVKESYRKLGWTYYLVVAILTVSFFVCDPTLQSMYFFYCTYRIQTILKMIKIAATVFVCCLFGYKLIEHFLEHRKVSFGFIPCYLLIYCGYFVSCVVNAGSGYLPRWWDALSSSLIPLLVFTIFDDKNSLKLLVKIFSACYLVFAVLNIIFYFFPELYFGDAIEWHELFFLGSKNRAGWPLMLGAFFHLLNRHFNERKRETLVYLFLLILNSYIVFCLTTLTGVSVLFLYYFIPYIRNIFQKLNFIVFVLFILLLFIMLMWFLLPITVSKPVYLLLSLFGKGPGLSDRYDIWETGIKLVLEKPIFGYGLGESTGIIPHTNIYGTTYHHAHNEFLQSWYEGGLVTNVIVIFTFFIISKIFQKSQDYKLAGLCKMTLFSFLLMLQADILPYYSWYMIALIAHISFILEYNESYRKISV